VREHCRTAALCARDYSDLDMVAPAREAPSSGAADGALSATAENYEVSTATANAALQFVPSLPARR